MISRFLAMAQLNRVASSVLFASGIALVLVGLSAALGFTIPGMVASIAAVAALLYAGGVWFGNRASVAAPSVHVFDRDLLVVGGPHTGQPVVSRFPEWMREELSRRCADAVAGQPSHFTCRNGATERVFDAAPIVAGRSSKISGVLVEGASVTTPPIPVDAAIGVI